MEILIACAANQFGQTRRATGALSKQKTKAKNGSSTYICVHLVCESSSLVTHPALLVFPDQGRCGLCSSKGCRRADRSALFLCALPLLLGTGEELAAFEIECTTARGRRRDPPGFAAEAAASADTSVGAAPNGDCAAVVVEVATLGGRTPSRSACLSPRAASRSSALADAALSRTTCSDLGVGSKGSVKVLPARKRSRKDSA